MRFPRVAIELALSAEERAAAEAMLSSIDANLHVFPRASIDGAHLERYVYLAALPAEAATISAALSAMAQSHGAGIVPSRDYVAVVSERMQTESTELTARALQAARRTLRGRTPEPTLLAQASQRALEDNLGLRFEALLALQETHVTQWNDAVVQALPSWLAAQPTYLIAATLASLRQVQARYMNEAWPADALLALASHADPGVRGLALSTAAARDCAAPAVREALLSALRDPHGYVRAAAITSLAECQVEAAIDPIFALLDDSASTQRVFHALADVGPATGTLVVSTGGSTVQLAVVHALRALSGGELALASGGGADAAAQNLQAVKAWHQRADGTGEKRPL